MSHWIVTVIVLLAVASLVGFATLLEVASAIGLWTPLRRRAAGRPDFLKGASVHITKCYHPSPPGGAIVLMR